MANANFAIEVEFISNVVKEFGDMEKVSKRAAAAISGSLTKLIKTQIRLKKAQATLADAFKAASQTVGLSTAELRTNNDALLKAATRVQLLKDRLIQVKSQYIGATTAGRGFLASLIAQKQNALDLSRRLDVAIKKIITYRIAFGVFREATEAFKDMFVQAVDMDDALGDLQKVLRGTSKDIERLRDAAFDFGIAFGRTPKDIVEGFKVFAQQGLTVNGILERTNALMLAVSATTLGTRDAIRALTVASKNFGDDFDNLSIVVDKFLVAEREVPVAAKDFADALAVVGQPAKELGLTLDELNGIVAAIGEVTQKSGKAIGTALKTVIARIVSRDSIRAFKDLKIAVLESAEEFRPLGDILRDLASVWRDLNEAERFNIAIVLGQKRRFNDFLALMNNFNQFLNVTEKSQLALNDAQLAANIELDKFRRRIESVNAAFSLLKESVGRDLLKSLIDLDGGFSSTLQTIAANAKTISTLIKTVSLLIVTFAALRGTVFVLGGLLRFLGVNYLTLTASIATATGAAETFGVVLNRLRFVLGPLFLAASIVTAIYLSWKAATDKTAQSQKELANIIRNNTEATEAADLAIQKLRLSTEDFADLKKELKIQKLLNDTLSTIDSVQERLDNLNRGTGAISSPIIGLTGQVGTFVTPEDRRNIKDTNEELRILDGRVVSLQAALAANAGKKVLPEQLQAEKLVKIQIALERLHKAGQELFLKQPGELFGGIDLSDLNFGKIVDERIITEKARTAIESAITRAVNLVLKTKQEALIPFEIKPVGVTEEFFPIDLFNRLQIRVQETIFRINNFNTEIAETKRLAGQLGKPFNEAAVKLKVFSSLLIEATQRRRELLAKQDAFQTQLDKNLATTIKIDGVEKNAGLILEDRKKLKSELLKLDGSIKIVNDEIFILEGKVLVPIKEARTELIGQLQTRLAMKRALAATNSSLDKQKIALGVLSVATTTQSQSGFKVAESLEAQLAIDKQLIKLDFQKAENAADNAIAKEKLLDSDKAIKAIAKINSDLAIKRLNTTNKIVEAESKVTKALIRQAQALKQEIAASISAGLTAIPSNIADRSKAENDLAIKRKELEFEIADFRKQLGLTTTDTERSRIQQNILEAQRGLRELQQDAKELGNIFTDVFDSLGGIADIAFRKSTENLVDALLGIKIGGQDIGQTIAAQVGGPLVEAGNKIGNSINEASTVSAATTGNAITVAHQTGALTVKLDIIDGHITGINIGSETIKLAHTKGAQAIQAAVQIGAQLIGQAVGGGGPRAGIGAGLGSLFASLIPGGKVATKLFTLAGGLLGGAVGGQFDNKRDFIEPLSSLTDAVNRNSIQIENSNRLLELSREFINAPARFTPPPVQGSFGGGLVIQNVNVNASSGAGGAAAARSFVDELNNSFNRSVRSNRSTARTFG